MASTQHALYPNVYQDIIKVENKKNIEFCNLDLVNILLKTGQRIEKCKKHYLIFKITILSVKSRFLFIAFLYSHLIIGVGKVVLDETLSLY